MAHKLQITAPQIPKCPLGSRIVLGNSLIPHHHLHCMHTLLQLLHLFPSTCSTFIMLFFPSSSVRFGSVCETGGEKKTKNQDKLSLLCIIHLQSARTFTVNRLLGRDNYKKSVLDKKKTIPIVFLWWIMFSYILIIVSNIQSVLQSDFMAASSSLMRLFSNFTTRLIPKTWKFS